MALLTKTGNRKTNIDAQKIPAILVLGKEKKVEIIDKVISLHPTEMIRRRFYSGNTKSWALKIFRAY